MRFPRLFGRRELPPEPPHATVHQAGNFTWTAPAGEPIQGAEITECWFDEMPSYAPGRFRRVDPGEFALSSAVTENARAMMARLALALAEKALAHGRRAEELRRADDATALLEEGRLQAYSDAADRVYAIAKEL